MSQKVLVTGGCGFIGSHLVDRLVEKGHEVRVLDNLEPQVHGGDPPEYLNPKAEYRFGDVGDQDLLESALDDVESVFHLAATVGVGQSMYRIRKYVAANTLETAQLMDSLVRHSAEGGLKKLVVASSMSVYGEGAYECPRCGPTAAERSADQVAQGSWDPLCAGCETTLAPVPTRETKSIEPSSVYALTKLDQELLCLTVGRAYGIPTVALRLFNVYGPRQALSNPYTGVAAIFSSRIKAGNAPVIYEDGQQLRDFVNVKDVTQAMLLALSAEAADGQVLNVGSGKSISVLGIAEVLLKLYGKKGELRPEISRKFRKGDVRHCFADIGKLESLGYEPRVQLEDGMRELCEWADRTRSEDQFERAAQELAAKRLVST